jgi:hypothetical protein
MKVFPFPILSISISKHNRHLSGVPGRPRILHEYTNLATILRAFVAPFVDGFSSRITVESTSWRFLSVY